MDDPFAGFSHEDVDQLSQDSAFDVVSEGGSHAYSMGLGETGPIYFATHVGSRVKMVWVSQTNPNQCGKWLGGPL